MRDARFRGASAAKIGARIDDLCERDEDKRIARMRIIEGKTWIEIGTEIGCDRRTASRHFDSIKDLI